MSQSIAFSQRNSFSFIAEQSTGSLLRNVMALYRSNFRPLFLTYFLPTFPVLVVQQLANWEGNRSVAIAASIVALIVSLFAVGALTVTISDIALGNEPSVRRSYNKLLKGQLWLKLFLTNVLQVLAILLGCLLFLIPGFVLMIRLLVTSTVVILEGESGRRALVRSMFLTKGHFWRLFGIYMLLVLIVSVVTMVVAFASGFLLGLIADLMGAERGTTEQVLLVLSVALTQGFMYPMLFIELVLMYYDLRARKEAYDLQALSEDMMR